MLQKFTTEGISPSRRLQYWNEIADEVFSGTFVNASAPQFTGKMWHWSLGELNMIRTISQTASVGRPGIDRDEEYLILHLQCRGSSVHRQAGMESRLEHGDFALASSQLPYSFDLSSHEMLVVEFPRNPLEQRLPRIDDYLSRRICGASPSGRIFLDFMLSLWRQGELLAQGSDWDPGLGSVFYDLAAQAIRGVESRPAMRSGPALLRRAQALVEARLAEPALRTADIAAELGLSIRTVQHLFAAIGTTPMAYILDHRLERAANRLIADPGITVTEVAFDHGFSDAGYFTRCFRQKFGVPPRSWRMGQ